MTSFQRIALFAVLLSFASLHNPATSDAAPRTKIAQPDTVPAERLPDQDIFRRGEMIKLRVTYLGFTAGYLTFKVNERTIDGRDVFQLKVNGESSGLAYWFYTVRDQFVSYVDAENSLSLGYDYRQNHGGEKEFSRVRYDHTDGLYFTNGNDTGTIPRYSMDVLSALYFLRSREMTVGDTYEFPVHLGDEAYQLRVKVEEREEIATSNRGWVDSFRIKPTLVNPKKEKEFREKLKNEQNQVRIWMSADSLKIPVQIGVPAKIGTFWGYLTEYKPGHLKDK